MSTVRTEATSAAQHDEAAAIARQNGLRYMNDEMPGITRSRHGKGFSFHHPEHGLITDKDEIARLQSLAIPPAWEDVWISPSANGHILATGRDARQRKQYRYHPHWRLVRDDAKYERMLAFAQALPAVRRAVHEDMHKPGLKREKVIASVVHLLQITFMRVGNDEYARTNHSFGLTTLRHRHVRVDGSDVLFRFRGKSGVQHEIKLHDPYVVRIIRKMRELPGQELFQYQDDEGELHTIDSGDVNAYLREVTGEDFSAKDFRTWAGTVLATLALQAFERFDSEAQAKKNVVRAIENVAKRLGNTPSICRKCYIHPAVVESYLEGAFAELLGERVQKQLVQDLHALTPEEAAVLALLQQRLREADDDAGRKRKSGKSTKPSSPRQKPAAAHPPSARV